MVAVAVAVALVPAVAGASRFITGQNYASPGTTVTSGNLYVAAGTVTVGSETEGDVLAAGGTVSITGYVHGDVLAAGGNVQILGPVDGDVRVIGGQVTLNQRIQGDLVVAGGTVHLLPSAWVDGDVHVAGGQVIMDGNIRGSLVAAAGTAIVNGTVLHDVTGRYGRLSFGPTADIGGNLIYRATTEATVADGAHIAGTTMFTAVGQWSAPGVAWPRVLWGTLIGIFTLGLLMYLGAAALVVWRFRRQSIDVMQEAVDDWWPSVGRGLAYTILIPLSAILLLVSIIGVLPGVVLWLAFFILWIIAKVLTGIFLGSLAVMAAKKTRVVRVSWGSALGGIVLYEIVSLIPIVGWVVTVVLMLALFGVMARRAHHVVW